MTANADMLE